MGVSNPASKRAVCYATATKERNRRKDNATKPQEQNAPFITIKVATPL